jgi:eukaryotic-like serine/threonine-protein kinase
MNEQSNDPESSSPATAAPPEPGDLPGLSVGQDHAKNGNSPPSTGRFGQFRILRAHARGGLGQVSLAMDESLGRKVAVKEIRPELAQNLHTRRRFIHEAEVTGQLEHPNIVPVYALGQDEHGRPYYAMRFVDGRTFEQLIAEYHLAPTPVAFQDLLRRFVAVCQAMAYAHSQGIVHRDLKPANIMTGQYGETLILDWGLAKRMIGSAVTKGNDEPAGEGRIELPPMSRGGVTQTGQAVGTPAYMPPEQAGGANRGLSAAADVYALGAILYQILTGRPPHQGDGRTEMISRAAQGEVSRPSVVKPTVAKALEAVCLKAMAQNPEHRYTTAEELAKEIERFLADEPVSAYREPLPERAARWARRHKPLVYGAAVAGALAIAGLVLNNVLVTAEKDRTAAALIEKQQALSEAATNLELAQQNERQAQEHLLRSLIREGPLPRAFSWRESYGEAWRLAERLGVSDFQISAGMLLIQQMSPPELLQFHVVGADDYALCKSVALADDKSILVTGVDGRLAVWDIVRGVRIREFEGNSMRGTVLVVTPDGRRAISRSGESDLAVWDVEQGRQINTIPAYPGYGNAVAISPDGRLAAVSDLNNLRLWDLESMTELPVLEGHKSLVLSAAFSPDGRTLLSGGNDNIVRLWDVQNGKEIRSFIGHKGYIRTIAWSADGRRFASGGMDTFIRIWDLDSGEQLHQFEHQVTVVSLAFSPDGGLISCSFNGMIFKWNPDTGQPQLWLEHGAGRRGAEASLMSDGHTVISCSFDGTVKVWDLAQDSSSTVLEHDQVAIASSFAVEGRAILTAGAQTVRLWDLATRRIVWEVPVEHRAWMIAVAPDNHTFALSGESGSLALHEMLTGREVRRLAGHEQAVTAVAFAPDGSWLASTGSDGTVRRWDAASGEELARLTGHGKTVKDVVISPDGTRLLTAGHDKMLRLWDVASGEQIREMRGHGHWIQRLALYPDGKRAHSGGWDRTIRLWDLETGEHQTLELPGMVFGLSLSPNGEFLAAAGEESLVRLWDAKEGTLLFQGSYGTDRATSVAFSPQGRVLMAAGREGFVRIWDFDLPRRFREFEFKVERAIDLLAEYPDDRAAVLVLADWYALRDRDGWAAELYEQARAAGAEISSLALARCYWKLDRLEDAEREFRTALGAGEATDDYIQLCLSALLRPVMATARAEDVPFEEEEVADAVAFDSGEVDRQPYDVGAPPAIGTMFTGHWRWMRMDASTRDTLRVTPDLVQSRRRLPETLLRQKRVEEAVTEFRERIRLIPADAATYSTFAWALATNEDPDLRRPAEAVEFAEKAIELAPLNGACWTTLGVTRYYAGQPQEAIEALHHATSLRVTGGSHRFFLAMAYWQLGEPQEAHQWYNQAIDWMDRNQPNISELVLIRMQACNLLQRTDDGRGRALLGHRLRNDKKPAEAEAEYQLAIPILTRLMADWPEITSYRAELFLCHMSVAWMKDQLGEYEEAVAHTQHAVQLDPGDAVARNNLGFSLGRLGRHVESEEAYREALRLQPRNQTFHSNLILVLLETNRLDEAAEQWEDLQPNTYNDLAWYLANASDTDVRRPAIAVELARKAIELVPQEGDYWNTLGAALYRSGEFQESIEALTKSVELGHGDIGLDYFFLAMAHWQLDHRDDAGHWYDKGVVWMDKNKPDKEHLMVFRDEARLLMERQE